MSSWKIIGWETELFINFWYYCQGGLMMAWTCGFMDKQQIVSSGVQWWPLLLTVLQLEIVL